MKKIGVISDTHLRRPDKALEAIFERHFHDADLIIHAGDLVTLDVLDCFALWNKEVIAVCGNMDFPDVARTFPVSRTVMVEDLRLGLVHGWGAPGGIRDRIRTSFDHVDAIIYGHTHQAFAGYEAGVYFFNPGSPTDSRFTTPPSIGIIRIDHKNITGEIISI